jgi:hypothetical protein
MSDLKITNVRSRAGVQTVVLDASDPANPDELLVVKIPRHVDHVAMHEVAMCKALSKINSPHFCCGINNVHFAPGMSMHKQVMEIIPETLARYAYDASVSSFIEGFPLSAHIAAKTSDDVIISQIKQVLGAIAIAQAKIGFCHNDLHASNIMCVKCDPNVVLEYIIDGKRVQIPTKGYIASIIDLGTAYVEEGPRRQTTTLNYANEGYITTAFNPMADPVLFLVTTTRSMAYHRSSKEATNLRQIVLNMIWPLDISHDNGRDENDQPSPLLALIDQIDYRDGGIFETHPIASMELMESLCSLPHPEYSGKLGPVLDKIESSFKSFIEAWQPIERSTVGVAPALLLLKAITDKCFEYIPMFSVRASRPEAVKRFRRGLEPYLLSYAPGIDITPQYERILCAASVFGDNIGKYYGYTVDGLLSDKQDKYDQMPVKSVGEMLNIIDKLLPTPLPENPIVVKASK